MKEKKEVTGTDQPSSVEEIANPQDETSLTANERVESKNVENVVEKEPIKEDMVIKEEVNKEGSDDETKSDEPETIATSKQEAVEESEEKNENESHIDEFANENFADYTKEELVEVIKKLAKHEDPFYAERYLKKIEPLFTAITKEEETKAKEVYIKENENAEGFSYRGDELNKRFEANSRLIHDRKHASSKDKEAQRQSNLKKAEDTLEKLRLFVDSEESSASFSKFKEIQGEWKAIGDVPSNQSKTLWANYNALINRFYDQRSIYFELKELDRKKNYEAKVKICERAEALVEFENLKEAINSLNDLHSDYKHLGPVPQELQEDLWVRFKAASDKVYERRKEFVSDLKVVLNENLAKKEALVSEIKLFTEFDSDRIKEWNAKTKELLQLQKTWESIGGLPREKSKHVNKDFWASFKTFFHNKGNFFKKLDAERKTNYDLKAVLVDKAEALKENTDWFKTANDFKALQQEWKTIGPVPEKVRNQLYNKFKAACDAFFDKKRSQSKDDEKNFKENLTAKKDIIAEIKEWSSDADAHVEEFKQKTKDFAAIGFVPRKDIASIKDKFSEAVNDYITSLKGDEEVKTSLRMEIELGDLLGSKNSEKAIYGKEQNVRRQLQQLENDVALWKNNLEFFAHSKTKNADDLRKEVNQKIEKAEVKVASLKGQLKLLRSM